MKNLPIATALAAGLLALSACSQSSTSPVSGYASILDKTTATVAFSASTITATTVAGTQGSVSFTLSEVGYSGLFKVTPAQSGCVVIFTTTPLPTPTNNVTGPTNQPTTFSGSIGTQFTANGATCVTGAGYTLPAVEPFTITDTLGNTVTATVTVNS